MPTYKKLVRDRIPEIIEATGKSFTIETLTNEQYIIELKRKLHEELKEFEEAETNLDALEELADLLELLHAASRVLGFTPDHLEKIRQEKEIERGAFHQKLFLIEVEDD
ncbi:nucleoside triphosphate pyrophosphohydrolase [Savagea sp. SN6]|uniref:Nucleoside triphosphate pyrophosphohydrolase n=1 Tax=Savagea serpentis TaxID=2785297 RepID=A0A8J7GA96_9BACL|nr:nucleoside triphosphate pyrophosphohydrolase [Savagea serpentis]MBF4501074.1 nucleoside triphosphate pyrophosphohydrolase [Savagea serpentis]